MPALPRRCGADPFFPSFIAGVETRAVHPGYALLLQVVPEHEGEQQSYRRLATRAGSTAFRHRPAHRRRPARAARRAGAARGDRGPAMPEASWRRRSASTTARGSPPPSSTWWPRPPRIAHVSGPPRWCTAGPAARRGRPPWRGRPPRGPCVEADFSAEAGAAATRELLDLADPPTAIVYANDLMAIAGLAVAVDRGIAVPGRLSVTGYEDTELAAHVQPPLTSVRTDVIGWGRAAADAPARAGRQRPATEIELPSPRARRARLDRPRPAPSHPPDPRDPRSTRMEH